MKIYKLSFGHDQEGTTIGWHSSKRAAEKEWLEAKKKHGEEVVTLYSITDYEIKPTKQAVLRFLNRCTPHTDNG